MGVESRYMGELAREGCGTRIRYLGQIVTLSRGLAPIKTAQICTTNFNFYISNTKGPTLN